MFWYFNRDLPKFRGNKMTNLFFPVVKQPNWALGHFIVDVSKPPNN